MIWERSADDTGTVTGCYRPASSPLSLSDSVTAVDMAPTLYKGRYLLAAGLDNGRISLHTWNKDNKEQPWETVCSLDQRLDIFISS